jgi:hypothetical protein
MTIQASCPKGHSLTLEEKLAGKKIRCPRCQTVFEVPDPDDDWDNDDEDEAISEKPLRKASRRRDDDDDEEDDDYDDDDYDEEEDDRRRKPARRSAPVVEDDDDEEPMDDATRKKLEKKLKKKQLKLVDVGLLLHYIKLCIYVVGILMGMVVVVLMMIIGAQAGEGGGGGIAGFMIGGIAILALMVFLLNLIISQIAPLIGIVGSFLCCWVPKKSEAKGTIIMSLTFDLVSMVAGLLAFLAIADVFGMEMNKNINMIFLCRLITSVCSISAWLTFLTFLRSLGKYIGEAALGNEALNLIARLVVQVISLILDIMCIFVIGRFFGLPLVAIIILTIVFLTIWLIIFVFAFYLRQMKLISAMRRAVQNKM